MTIVNYYSRSYVLVSVSVVFLANYRNYFQLTVIPRLLILCQLLVTLHLMLPVWCTDIMILTVQALITILC